MEPEAKQSRHALEIFNKEVQTLHGDDLLDRKIAFDNLPPATVGERNLRRAQGYTLGAALLKEFGLGNWQKALADRRKRGPDERP